MSPEPRPPIPVTVIGGYLGAGKTTLVNALLRDPQGERLAVIVNDFGSVAIDAELIESHDGETIELVNGCVCCSLTGGLADALFALRDGDRRVDRIVIEASGVADPVATAQYAHLPGFELDGVVVLAAADAVRRQSRDTYVGRQVTRQLVDADVIVLTKTDLVDDERLAALRVWLADAAPCVPVVEAVDGDVRRAVLFGTGSTLHGRAADAHTAHHETWTFVGDVPVDVEQLVEIVASLPAGIVRAKGVATPVGDPAARVVVQRVGRRTTSTRTSADLEPGVRLVVIGLPGSGDDPAVTNCLSRLSALITSFDHEVSP